MQTAIQLTGHDLTIADVEAVVRGDARVELSATALEQIAASRALIDRVVAEHIPTYGVNTGFGRFVDVQIEQDQVTQLQLNLLRSHACGVGEPFPDEV
ncbi:MAG: aromatic amino acid lyase, partial [Gaiellales bacterium]